MVAVPAAAVAVDEIRKDEGMNIFKKQNSEDKKQDDKKEKAPEGKKLQVTQRPDPHINGGCCGSCGGQQGKRS